MVADYRTRSPDEIPLDAQHRSLISEHFSLGQLTLSDTALRHGIDNRFEERAHFEAAIHLAREVMQKVRDEFGALKLNSAYRCQSLERALKQEPAGWVSQSQHARGEACDIEVPSLATLDLAGWIERNLEFDQLICECHDPRQGPNSGWVHVSLKPPAEVNRREVLSYVMDPDEAQYVYVDGLVESLA